MKRLWISAALILSLALLAGCHVLYLGRLTGELVDLLDQAQEQVLQDDWSQAGTEIVAAARVLSPQHYAA